MFARAARQFWHAAVDARTKLTFELAVWASLALVLALSFVADASGASSVQGGLSRAASALAGQPVVVACASLPGLEGEEDAGQVSLDLSTCAPLLHRADAGPDNIYAAEAASTLAHEVGHVLLGPCEYRAEHYAMTHWRHVYRLLGFGTADSITATYVLALHQTLPPAYLTPAPGG
jgi:hypothetical protein